MSVPDLSDAADAPGTRLTLTGVRTRNLKGIDVDLPANALVVVTGVSGAGKTSLVVETLAAEGQRRFIETFPASARRILDRLERPDADEIGPLPPPILLRRSHSRPSRRATASTLSEIQPVFQHLFAVAGQTVCPTCQIPVVASTAATIAGLIAGWPEGLRFQICFRRKLDPAVIPDIVAAELLEAGLQRVLVSEETLVLKVPLPDNWPRAEEWLVVVDRLQTGKISAERLQDSLEQALQRGAGECCLLLTGNEVTLGRSIRFDGADGRQVWLYTRMICAGCQREFPVPSPRLFSFHSPHGACEKCQGVGEVGAAPCPKCHGFRLNEFALAVQFDELHLGEWLSLSVKAALERCRHWLANETTATSDPLARPALIPLQERLTLLTRLGLDYLTLNRSGRTLSSGETQRLALAATCAVPLVESLYVLDEPAAGLHPREVEQLIEVLHEIRNRRNSVVVVEHLAAVIRAAEAVVDLGPGAGPDGGQLLHSGTPATLQRSEVSLTGAYLSGSELLQRRTPRTPAGWLSLRGIQHHTLNQIDAEFPLGSLCAVTGVSGSGKSTLVHDCLYPAVLRALGKDLPEAQGGVVRQLEGAGVLQSVVFVDQSLPVATGRGNVVTASGMWAEIRTILAATSEAKVRQFTAGTFSFHNASGGRCLTCAGLGVLSVDLQFLADLQVVCPDCRGSRFQRDVLEVKYRGLSVAEILKLTVGQALPFFRGRARLQRRLKVLKDVGLGYLQLGQPVSSLSGGETQRLQLATQMTTRAVGATLYLLDEPARGLHPAEIQGLVNWFDDLLNEGHSLIVVEHRPELISLADYVIEMGPGAGPDGGRIISAQARQNR